MEKTEPVAHSSTLCWAVLCCAVEYNILNVIMANFLANLSSDIIWPSGTCSET